MGEVFIELYVLTALMERAKVGDMFIRLLKEKGAWGRLDPAEINVLYAMFIGKEDE